MVATSASAVLGYRQGNWESAIRTEAEDGTSSWQGSLTSMEGGYGFWIQTDQFESIETLIPEVDPASTLPTVPVAGGWNLLGVIDVRQAKAGDSPLEKSEADAYFTSIPWRVAYSFETIQNAWTKLIPEVTAQVDDPDAATERRTIDDPRRCGNSERQGLLGMVVRAGHAGTVRTSGGQGAASTSEALRDTSAPPDIQGGALCREQGIHPHPGLLLPTYRELCREQGFTLILTFSPQGRRDLNPSPPLGA